MSPKVGLINTLPKYYKPIANFVEMQENPKHLATSRFVQDVIVNWAPKAVFARSFADFAEMTFLEFAENALVYLGPKVLGENLFRKIFSKKSDKIATTFAKIKSDKFIKGAEKTKLINKKAAISTAALAIPLIEYSLSFIKNIFTLKFFKQADFNNIANLNKDKTENDKKQNAVKKSAVKHLKLAGGIFAGCLTLAGILASGKVKSLNKLSEFILAPGTKLFKGKKCESTINKYFSLEFENNDGKLGLSKGMLTACVTGGFFGYTKAAKDRGKQNLLEVLFRYPLVGLYVITGSSLLEGAYKRHLKNKDGYKDIIKEDLKIATNKELEDLANKKGSPEEVSAEFKNLFSKKAKIIGLPFAFSLVVMGLFVAGVSRYFTQYRYNQELKKQKAK